MFGSCFCFSLLGILFGLIFTVQWCRLYQWRLAMPIQAATCSSSATPELWGKPWGDPISWDFKTSFPKLKLWDFHPTFRSLFWGVPGFFGQSVTVLSSNLAPLSPSYSPFQKGAKIPQLEPVQPPLWETKSKPTSARLGVFGGKSMGHGSVWGTCLKWFEMGGMLLLIPTIIFSIVGY